MDGDRRYSVSKADMWTDIRRWRNHKNPGDSLLAGPALSAATLMRALANAVAIASDRRFAGPILPVICSRLAHRRARSCRCRPTCVIRESGRGCLRGRRCGDQSCLACFTTSGSPRRFDALHAFGAEACARAAKRGQAAVQKSFIQMSAIGADSGLRPASMPAPRLKAKSACTRTICRARSSSGHRSYFGPEDDLFNRFATGWPGYRPYYHLIGNGHTTRFQPVFAGDVAEGIANIIGGGQSHAGKAFEFGGPQVLSLKQIMEFTLQTTGRSRLLVPVPFALAKIKAAVLGMLPNPLITMDQVELLKTDNVVSEQAYTADDTLTGLGIQPESVEAIVPSYLCRYRKAGQFSQPDSV